jgi:hypothetical protein
VTEVVLSRGVVRFDDSVIEVFGFVYENSIRMHITQLRELDYNGKDQLKIKADPGKYVVARLEDEDEPLRGDLEALIEEMRSAAPSMKEGR